MVAAPVPTPGPILGDLPARFVALRAHPDFESALAHVPLVTTEKMAAMSGIVSAAIFIPMSLMSLAIAVVFPPAFVFALVMVAGGVFALAKSIRRAAQLRSGELKRVPSALVDERTEISGGKNNSRVRTSYYACLQSEGGKRQEYEVDGEFSGKIAPGDMGVAYFKGNHLIDFERIPV